MTAETAGAPGAAGRAGTAGTQAAHGTGVAGADGDGERERERQDDGYWAPGTRILWRYRANGTGHPHICRPVTVVRDTPDLLAAWVAPGTVCVKPEMADGTPVHHEPLDTRYTRPRRTVLSRWFGTGVLKLARPDEPWSVWLFWERDWQFKNWYVNLEEPHRRWPGGIDSEDHFLDIAVYPDRGWEWRDEDEFAAARRAGLVDDGLAERVRAAGSAVVEQIESWASPFSDGWENWRPDPRWPVPLLPRDWDGRPPPAGPEPAGSGANGTGTNGGTNGTGVNGTGTNGTGTVGAGADTTAPGLRRNGHRHP
ncbi:DUF402 domain-containing protein [Streptomyces bathyalis]|uniref:DUF402 domain-containing protein n=1 Tax=Streptomyces bathyalis TaxID=2710756 RepID=A0A7T1WS41_9ACTN|nr:DUF402 domain-containing protein [Streptomyces bathyalis]